MEQHGKQPSKPTAQDDNGMKCTIENVDDGPVTNPVVATSHANPDVEMSPRDNPNQQPEPGSDERALVSITGQLANAAEEVIRLREEVEQLGADLSNATQDRNFAQTKANTLRTMRKQTKDLLESMKETIGRLQEERDDACDRCDELNERAKKWRKSFKDLKEETSNKKSCSDRYPSPVPPTTRPPMTASCEREDQQFYSMYEGDLRGQALTDEEVLPPSKEDNTRAVSAARQSVEQVGSGNPSNVPAVLMTASHSYAQVTGPTNAPSWGPQIPQPPMPATMSSNISNLR